MPETKPIEYYIDYLDVWLYGEDYARSQAVTRRMRDNPHKSDCVDILLDALNKKK